ncbi:MAG: Asp-tRNA(Asn)/Glu-tRNA(Gln) amidotransferase subunit GatC [Deltaproteobacteria bacterium]|jgi:aspartyl-tRNA(Asn)/glutamyl-tRNA(Gln) amidotransferase subunit C|nr:Asp-tRNA(Asn)/Glu-tRNA(Gln) amidotransferase subunit GatC [Deltaproteobacteria bacterium]
MTINPQTALAMAKLARLGLDGDPADSAYHARLAQLAQDFDRIVSYMDILAEVDTQGVEPMYSPMVDPLGPRLDEPLANASSKADHILERAPETVGRFFSVPRIF